MRAIPYLFFAGDCSRALNFYRDAIGAEIRTLVHFRDVPGAKPEAGDRVMHAEFALGGSTIFASDAQSETRPSGGYAISLEAADDARAERLFAALSDGGKIQVPLMTTPFASRFGMLTDRFGTPWIVTTPQAVMA